MYLLEVIPFATLPPQVPQLLSYFSTKKLTRGSIVEVGIGNRKVMAVVVSSSSIEDNKILLKKSIFQLKKISKIISEKPIITDRQLKLVAWLAKNYYSPLGLCLKTVTAPISDYTVDRNQPADLESKSKKVEDSNKTLILLSRAKDVLKNLEPEIKKKIRQKKQVAIIVPEISMVQHFYDALAGYFEIAVIHSKIPSKKLEKNWQEISSGSSEIVIGTRQALFGEFSNLGLIVLEDPINEAYKSDMTPKYNTLELALKVAELNSSQLLLTSQVLDVKNYSNIKNNTSELRNKINRPDIEIKIVDMVQEIKSGNYSIFSRDMIRNLKENIEKNKKILLFSSRRGYSGYLLCGNCGFSPKCPNCSTPLRVHGLSGSNLICFRCSLIQKSPDNCSNCHSHEIKPRGFAGTQKIEEELKRVLETGSVRPEIFIIDSSLIKTAKAEKELLEKMKNAGNYICISTQMILSHRYTHSFDFIGITNADGLLSVPDFRSEEEIIHQFEKLIDFDPKGIVIQTYNPESRIINLLPKGNYDQFNDEQLQIRKLLAYPPFNRLVKLSFSHHDKAKVIYESRLLSEKLKMALFQRKLDQTIKMLGPLPAFIERARGLYAYNIILKILPEQRLDEVLKFVPLGWTIDADPKSIL